MLNIVATRGKKQRRGTKILLILLYTIIPFLAFFSYITVISHIPSSAVLGIFIDIPPKINYKTFKVSFDSDMPIEIQNMIKVSVDDIEMDNIKRFEFTDRGKYTIEYTKDSSEAIYFKEYLPVGHIYWIKSVISLDSIDEFEKIYVFSKDLDISKILLKQFIKKDIEIEGVEDVVSMIKGNEKVLGFVSSNDVTTSMKVLSLDSNYFLEDNGGKIEVGYTVKGGESISIVKSILKRNMELKYGESTSVSRKDIVKINMSGVVALTRGLAVKMDAVKDYKYPAKKLGSFLADADLVHVSNEVSFVDGCTSYSGMRFCSRPEYIETLKASGVNIVELTGNHNNDFGAENNRKSIEMYKELGWDYFGGGLDSEDASKILYKEIKGSTIAFVGYNYYDTVLNTGAIASSTRAGANSYSVEKLQRDIQQAKENADIVVITFQFQECYSYPSSDVIYPICYKPLSTPDQKGVFRKAIDFGADVVVGTQAHQPQTYEVYKNGLIFYGLGNLYFDQYRWIGTRQGLILSLYVQEGRLIQAKLTPTIMDRDLIPKVADEKNKELLLNLLNNARSF